LNHLKSKKLLARWRFYTLQVLIVVLALGIFAYNLLESDAPHFEQRTSFTGGLTFEELYAQVGTLAGADDIDGALTVLNLLIDNMDEPPTEYYIERARLLGELQHYAEVAAELEMLKDQNRVSASEVAGSLCFYYAWLADFASAEGNCVAADDIYDLCYIHSYTGDYEQALDECNMAIEASPDFSYSRNNRGRAHLMLGHYREAIVDTTRSIALNNAYPHFPYSNRALASLAIGKYDAAYADLIIAQASDANHPDIYLGLGIYYDKMDNPAQALVNYCYYVSIAWVTPAESVTERINELGGCDN
jgi:tetratricopeptide (TPR) repeat protein